MRSSAIMPVLLASATVAFAQAATPLDGSIDAAADYLVRQMQPNGQFVYRIKTNPAGSVQPKYNIVRHAGAMYALIEYYQLRRRPKVKDTLMKANGFLQSQVAELQDVPDVLAVWSDPDVNLGRDGRKAKLGATGLGLAALSRLEHVQPNSTNDQRLRWLGNFLLFMQKDDGSFYSFYLPAFPGRDDSWTSLYYPGEAALGLLLLDEIQPDAELVEGAYEALRYLARTRRGETNVPADHWALIASSNLLQQQQASKRAGLEIDHDLLISHAIQIVRLMLREQASQNGHRTLDGCFSHDGRTTPTSTRLEGLLATLKFLPAEHRELREEINDACHRGIRFLMRNQISQGAAKGGIPRAIALLAQGHPGWDPSFNERATEVRIDYVQHALSAMIAYRRRVSFNP